MLGDINHVILCGSVNWDLLQHFVKEFYHPSANRATKVVVICSDAPWSDEKWKREMAVNETFRNNVVYIDGNVLEEHDMERAKADMARAFFVVATLRSNEDAREDSSNLKRLLAIRDYAPRAPIYALNTHSDSNYQFRFAMKPFDDDNGEDDTYGTFEVRSANSILQRTRSSMFGVDMSSPHNQYKDKRKRSTSICLRDMEAALISENVFCNGLGTLITNLIMHEDSAVHSNDKPWMTEYKLGAACRMLTEGIPEAFHGRTVESAAMILYDCGIILIATRSGDAEWKVLQPDSMIRKRMLGMYISYLSGDAFIKAMQCAAAVVSSHQSDEEGETDSLFSYYSEEDTGSSHAFPHMSSSNSESDDSYEEELRTAASRQEAETVLVEEKGRDVLDLRTRRRLEPVSSHQSLDQLSSDASNMKKGGRKKKKKKKTQKIRIYSRQEELPVRLNNHILICFNERGGLNNLKLLLERIWRLATVRDVGRTPIVVIHDDYPRKFEVRFAKHAKDLFLIRGSGQSLDSLRQAQLQNAMAVVIGSPDVSEKAPNAGTDSVVMFTVMTLDFLLGENSDTFVLGVLGSEESMQVLPAPNHARRKKLALGERHKPIVLQVKSEGNEEGDDDRAEDDVVNVQRSLSVPHALQSSLSADVLQMSATMPEITMASGGSDGDLNRESRAELRKATLVHKLFMDLNDIISDEEDIFVRKEVRARSSVIAEEEAERQRFASGELVIPWLACSSLVREFNEPGFSQVVLKLLGVRGGDVGWIQLIAVPPRWGGRNYREVMKHLLSFGVIPIGLYRCVNAPVRHLDTLGTQDADEIAEEPEATGLDDAEQPEETMYLMEWAKREMQTTYVCPTTNCTYYYHAQTNGENKLPYVYTNPQPFTLISDQDAVYCIADPSKKIPEDW